LEFPFLKRIYGFYGAEDKLTNVHLPNERHDFGINKRQANYDFFIKVFNLDRTKLDESKVKVLEPSALQSHIKPVGGIKLVHI